jgi:Lrp/AsnC family leucine-responsive transcriptional regulator
MVVSVYEERNFAMFLDGLDTIDQQILQLLIQNARASYSDIGQRIGISRVAVKSRIQALEQKGIIEEYTTIVNPRKISGAMSCYFEIETSPESLGQVMRILEQNEIITQIYRVTGRNKLHVHAVASSNEEMEKLIQEVIDPLPGVVSCGCNVILSRVKDIKGLRL